MISSVCRMKLFLFRVDRFSEGTWCAVGQTWPQKLSPLAEMADSLSINIFYCIITSGNGVGPQVQPTLVMALP